MANNAKTTAPHDTNHESPGFESNNAREDLLDEGDTPMEDAEDDQPTPKRRKTRQQEQTRSEIEQAMGTRDSNGAGNETGEGREERPFSLLTRSMALVQVGCGRELNFKSSARCNVALMRTFQCIPCVWLLQTVGVMLGKIG